MTDFPWPPGTATGVGSLPGSDPAEALRLVLGELPELPHLPELPDRGPGADLVGRGCAHLVDLHVDRQPSGWRLVPRPGVDERRARDLLARDLDLLQDLAAGHEGAFKVQVCGPWTLAASVELTRGDVALADPGATRDVGQALADGVATLVGELQRRLPAARLLLQVDEPSLPAVLAGRVPVVSGFGTIGPVEPGTVEPVLRGVLDAAAGAGAFPLVHCCARDVPFGLLADAGARAVAVDASLLSARHDDELGQLVERGVGLFLGLVPSLGPGVAPTTRAVVEPARALWSRLGFAPQRLGDTVVVTPQCGLAGASEGWVRTALPLCRRAARALHEAPEVSLR